MNLTAREYICAAIGMSLGLALMSAYGVQWWMPLAAMGTAVAAMQIVR